MKHHPRFLIVRFWVPLAVCLSLVLMVPGMARAEAMARGLVSWDEGDPAAAARSFQLAVDEAGPSAAAYFNLGLALEQSGDSVGALVALLRARALEPGSAQIQGALKQLLAAQGWALPAAPDWATLARHRGLPLLYVVGAVAFWLGLSAVVVGWLRRTGRLWWISAGAVGVLLGGGLVSWAVISDPLVGERDWAVVEVEAESGPLSLRASPMESAGLVEKVSSGAVVQEISRRAGWSYCRLPSGKEGWLPAKHLQRVLPDAEA